MRRSHASPEAAADPERAAWPGALDGAGRNTGAGASAGAGMPLGAPMPEKTGAFTRSGTSAAVGTPSARVGKTAPAHEAAVPAGAALAAAGTPAWSQVPAEIGTPLAGRGTPSAAEASSASEEPSAAGIPAGTGAPTAEAGIAAGLRGDGARSGGPRPAPADDAETVERSRERPELFAEIFHRHFAEIHRYVARRLGADAADDIAAETFLAAFRRRDRFDPARGTVRSWLYGIATNQVGLHRRAERRHYRALARTPADGVADGHEDRVAARVSAGEAGADLARALARLSPGDRDVLLLVALAELSYDEVAAALGLKTGTVASRLHRARKKVRAALGGADRMPTTEGTTA